MAAERGVDLGSIQGTGVGGRIRKQDVIAAAEAKAPAPAAAAPAAAAPAAPATPSPLRGTTEKVSRLRQVIATRMVESLQTSAQLTQVHEIDMTNIARLREREKAESEHERADKERDKREDALRQQLEALRSIERGILEREERLRRKQR